MNLYFYITVKKINGKLKGMKKRKLNCSFIAIVDISIIIALLLLFAYYVFVQNIVQSI